MVKNTFAFFGVLAILLLSLGFTSATTSSVMSISNVSAPSTIAENAGTFTFTFNVTYNGTSSDVTISFDDSDSNIGSVSIPDVTGMDQGDVRTVTGTVSGFANLGGQNLVVRINATRGTARDDETSFSVSITDVTTPGTYNFCEIAGEVGHLEITEVSFTNNGEGGDDEWYLLDEVEIEVEVENNDNENVKDVLVAIMILDDNDNDVTSDFDFEDEEIDLGTIKDDDSEIAVFKISEVPADLESGSYRVYVKAYSEDNEDEECTAMSNDLNEDYYQSVEITSEDDPAVIVKDGSDGSLKISASCGDQNVQLPLMIYNLGSDKEEKVMVNLYNSQLGLDEKIIIDDLKSGKRKEIVFSFNVPASLSKTAYTLDIVTYYDYDKDEDELDEFSYGENSADDLDRDFSAKLEVLSCKGLAPTVKASLESPSEVSTDLIVKTTITNNGNQNNFVISASGFESWATLKSITPTTASLAKGGSVDVMVTLTPNKVGSQSFVISTIVDGETYNQPVSFNIAEKPSILPGITNVMLYIIVGIAVLIVLIFLVLIIRIARR